MPPSSPQGKLYPTKEPNMATYLALVNFTEQGIRNVKDTVKRTEAYRAMAKKCGCTVKDSYWLMGQYDMAAVVEAPNDETMTALQLSAASLGNVHGQTLRAFSASEIEPILQKMAT
jgi:uncharacterized protein with GYD domain